MALEAWLTLLFAAQTDRRSWSDALAKSGSATALLGESHRTLEARGISREAIDRLRAPDGATLERWAGWLAAPSRFLITRDDARYPPLLAASFDPPLALWVEGAAPQLIGAPQLAMVGSRNPTASGRQTAEQFARYLSMSGVTITSGLALGIDGASHRGALGGGAGTVAVLGGGIDVLYPREHAALAAEIRDHGVVLSEYPPGVEPRKHHFPDRNRIIACLALGTLVVEATVRSGSLITAQRATENGRDVFAIPGSIHNPLARGCHHLIRQGAKLVEEANDVLIELAPQLPAAALTPPATPASSSVAPAPTRIDEPDYQNLLRLLDYSPTPIGELADRVQLTPGEVSSMLLVLELEGFVEALPGGRYSRLATRS
jgi:DNA processing protein